MAKAEAQKREHIHRPPAYDKAFFIATLVNALFVALQVSFAYLANSTSLLADAIHNLGDVLSLLLAWVANTLMRRLPTSRSTYGLKKTSILAAFINGALLIFTCGIIVTEAIYKFFSPEPVHALMVIIVAGFGILVNGATAVLFIKGTDDLNIRAAFLHLVYDALVSLGVVLSALLLYFTGWFWLDPVVGFLIAVVILRGTWALFADSFRMMIDAVPQSVSIEKIRSLLINHPGVQGLHDLHVWALSTRENALSVHLWMPEAPLSDEARFNLAEVLRREYNIHHTTIQVERRQDCCKDICISLI
ncbi:cation efflux system protein [Legionella londiniensis]|uniref:Cation efflux system protein n=2 Tax=Legionella londiniensis TaxID=45068 RepID=A0A0W0VSK9_9GAMM|nr:cation diffusion facilitator family transporter [Legionella londiniensis]KTD23064.1 cation efflux system protein [Legionella londiniensis]STX94081.1 cation efflux system protein [Legionella londiniensis]